MTGAPRTRSSRRTPRALHAGSAPGAPVVNDAAPGALRFATRYGGFSADLREYVITRPDTPRPWANVIAAGDYGTIVTQAGTGYSWLTHASFNRITRWEQDLVADGWGKFLYCRDRDDGATWSLTWQPMQGGGAFRCRHGLGYSVLARRTHGVESSVAVFVDPDHPVEYWRVRLTNRGRRARALELFSYFEWNLGPSPDTHREFHRLFIETAYDRRAGALLATKHLNTIAPPGGGEPWNVPWPHWAFHGATPSPAAWESDKQAFLGRHGTPARPAALARPRLSDTTGRWQDGIAALQVPIEVPAGAVRDVVFTLGVAPDRAAARTAARRALARGAVTRAWKATRARWDAVLEPLQVSTPDPAFDALVNVWLRYQAIAGRLEGRTGYYQPGGAFGFRDQLQDSQVWLPLDPARTRAQLLLHAAHQYADGTALHWWHPITEQGLKKPLNDDLLWLPFVTLAYLRETADDAVLDERVPFLPGDGGAPPGGTPLYEHCRRALDYVLAHRSPRGVPRMGAGDWNDGLSAIGREGRAESVWMAHFLVGLLEQWAVVEERRSNAARARRDRAAARAMRTAINRHFWDGAWYVRGTRDDGRPIGARACREGKIFLNAQTWAILSDVVPPARLPALLRSMERHLYRPHGAVLLAPAYRTPDPSIGYLTRYAPGTRENGGYYVHAALWAMQAECRIGRADHAWRLWHALSPIERGMDADHWAAEPYVTSGSVDGPDSPFHGRGGWSWYSGSAAWMFRIATEWLLGVRPEWDGLRVSPCLPPGWSGFRMTRRFRGAEYRITVGRGHGAALTLDGRPLSSTVVPPQQPGGVHEVHCLIDGGTLNGRRPHR